MAGALFGLALLSGVATALAQGTDAPVVFDARVVGDQYRVRFVADMSEPVMPTVFTLANPDRIVVDMPEVKFALPERAGEFGRGLITAFRYGRISPGKSRIVIDLMAPAAIDKTFVIEAASGQPARLVIDAVPTTRERFDAATLAYREQQKIARAARADRAFAPAENGHDRPLIVIDPGHGGIDAGARGSGGTVEKDVVLAYARVLGAKLAETGRYRVLHTREEDLFVGLRERVDIARQVDADIFVSIHANSFRGKSVRGAIIYTASDRASDRMAAELAASENSSDILAGADIDDDERDTLTDILVDLTRRETRKLEVILARGMIEEMRHTVEMFKIPHQQASFKVLEAPDVVSVLVELGYLTNPTDEKLLTSSDWQVASAKSIVAAFDTFVAARDAGAGYASRADGSEGQ